MSFSRVLGAAADPASRAAARYAEEASAGCLGSASKDSVRCSEEGSAGCLGSASKDSVCCSVRLPGMKSADRSVLQELFQWFGLYIQMNSDRRNLS